MRYTKYFKQHLNSEWEDYYVEYERIRLLLGKTSNKIFCNTLLYELQKSNAYCLLLADKAVRESKQFYNILKGLMGEKKLRDFKIVMDKCRDEILNDISQIRKDKVITTIPNEWSSDSDNQGENSQSCYGKDSGTDGDFFTINNEECFNETDDLNNKRFVKIKKCKSKSKNISKSRSKRFIKNILPMGKSYSIEKKKKRLYMILDDILKIYKFKTLNITAIKKLCYKFSDVTKNLDNTRSLLSSHLENTFIFKDKNLKILKDATKNIFKEIFENEKIKGENDVYDRITKVHKNNFFVLLLSGIFIGLNSFGIYKYCLDLIAIKNNFPNSDYSITEKKENNFSPLFYLGKFLGFNNFFYSVILFVFCLEIFKAYKINSTFIFRFNKISTLTNQNLILITTLVQTFYLFLKFNVFDIRQFCSATRNLFSFSGYIVLHMSLYLECYFFLFCIIFLVIPLKSFYISTRLYLPAIYARNICLPLTKVTFRHFYFIGLAQSMKYSLQQLILTFLGDQKCPLDTAKNSNYKNVDTIIANGTFFGSYYSPNDKNKFISEIFLLIFPFIRIFQCYKRFNDSGLIMPHVGNSIRYLIYIISTILYQIVSQNIKFVYLFQKILAKGNIGNINSQSPNLNIFAEVFLIIILFCYAFIGLIWDFFVDFAIKRGKYLYHDLVYAFICIFDLLVKPSKVIKLIFYSKFLNQSEEKRILTDYFISTSSLIMKFLWTIIRVEVEHLNNCDKLKISKSTLMSLYDFFYENDTGDLENNENIIEMKKEEFKDDFNKLNIENENRGDNEIYENLSEISNCSAVDINSETDDPINDQVEVDINVYSSDSDSLYSE